MPLRKIAASLAENSGFSCDWGPAVIERRPLFRELLYLALYLALYLQPTFFFARAAIIL